MGSPQRAPRPVPCAPRLNALPRPLCRLDHSCSILPRCSTFCPLSAVWCWAGWQRRLCSERSGYSQVSVNGPPVLWRIRCRARLGPHRAHDAPNPRCRSPGAEGLQRLPALGAAAEASPGRFAWAALRRRAARARPPAADGFLGTVTGASSQGGLARVSTPGFSHGGAAAAAFPPAPENSTVMADYKRCAPAPLSVSKAPCP